MYLNGDAGNPLNLKKFFQADTSGVRGRSGFSARDPTVGGGHLGAYCISPAPKDQSSRLTSTRLIQTSSLRMPVFSWIPLATAL